MRGPRPRSGIWRPVFLLESLMMAQRERNAYERLTRAGATPADIALPGAFKARSRGDTQADSTRDTRKYSTDNTLTNRGGIFPDGPFIAAYTVLSRTQPSAPAGHREIDDRGRRGAKKPPDSAS